jgi:hypothetical protein
MQEVPHLETGIGYDEVDVGLLGHVPGASEIVKTPLHLSVNVDYTIDFIVGCEVGAPARLSLPL